MFFAAELEFLKACLAKCHVPVCVAAQDELREKAPDTLTGFAVKGRALSGLFSGETVLRERVLYQLRDAFQCNYLFLKLPETNAMLVIGPYLTEEVSGSAALHTAEKLNLSPTFARDLENYYSSVVVLPSGSHVFHMLEAFCEHIWRGMDFQMKEINIPEAEFELEAADEGDAAGPLWKMELMEKRYEYENELIEAVTKGQLHKAKMLLPVFSTFSFEKRLSDPLRNIKNYCIITNTLLRKAAESGGVHPVFLDRISSQYAMKIEAVPSVMAAQGLILEMFDRYCRLVRKHSLKDYSPQVQKAIVVIESNHTTDLSLSSLAELQGISPGYLSRLFKKEMGMNITEYVNQRRVEHASSLLTGTRLQIQSVAQQCGIMDVQYFSRLFKKIKGVTPNEYRKMNPERG